MQDKIYESCQYLAYGLLVGYFGLYIMDWVKSWKSQKVSSESENQKERQASRV